MYRIVKFVNMIKNACPYNKKRSALVLLIIVFLFHSCSKNSGDEASAMKEFEEFYQNFQIDEAYQLEHINFPLEGLPANADAETIATQDFQWQAEDWVMQRPFDFSDGKFKRELVTFGDDLVVEKIVHQNGKFGTIRRFAKLGGEWYLIYYAGLNRIQSE